jgi:hypothetical protein
MKQISAGEFYTLPAENQALFKHWTIPLKITEFVDFSDLNLTHLSPLLTFAGKNHKGDSADFSWCKQLTLATGKFKGAVNFSHSGIHSIHNLHIENPNTDGDYADFSNCPNLKTLEGWDLSKQITIEPEKLAAEKERRALQKFHKNNPQTLPFL